MRLSQILVGSRMVESMTKAKTLLNQGGVRINGQKILTDIDESELHNNDVIQAGKRNFIRIKKWEFERIDEETVRIVSTPWD